MVGLLLTEQGLLQFGHLKLVTLGLLLMPVLLLMFYSLAKFITSSWNGS